MENGPLPADAAAPRIGADWLNKDVPDRCTSVHAGKGMHENSRPPPSPASNNGHEPAIKWLVIPKYPKASKP